MQVGDFHLCYCTNIFSAESWEETFSCLKKEIPPLSRELQIEIEAKGIFLKEDTFSLGLRLSARAAEEILEKGFLSEFQKWLERERISIFTINGFPYGNFSRSPVKEKVYFPDWSSEERLKYTKNLFSILSVLAPESLDASVSTVPISFKGKSLCWDSVFRNLSEMENFLCKLEGTSNRKFFLGLEPEPFCTLENTQECVDFFSKLPESSHLGITYDTCHFAVEYEEILSSLQTLYEKKIPIVKMQISNALRSLGNHHALKTFCEETYLHQTFICKEKEIVSYLDLPEALEKENLEANEWRVHYHIPLYEKLSPPLSSTSFANEEALSFLKEKKNCYYLEIETYTYSQFPKEIKKSLREQIIKEYLWIFDILENEKK